MEASEVPDPASRPPPRASLGAAGPRVGDPAAGPSAPDGSPHAGHDSASSCPPAESDREASDTHPQLGHDQLSTTASAGCASAEVGVVLMRRDVPWEPIVAAVAGRLCEATLGPPAPPFFASCLRVNSRGGPLATVRFALLLLRLTWPAQRGVDCRLNAIQRRVRMAAERAPQEIGRSFRQRLPSSREVATLHWRIFAPRPAESCVVRGKTVRSEARSRLASRRFR